MNIPELFIRRPIMTTLVMMSILVFPRAFVDVMESRPAIVENCRSRGVAMADAMVSGLAPGRPAVTWMVGKSTFGRSLTGSSL